MSKKKWIVCWRGFGGIWLRTRRGGRKEYDKLTPPLWKGDEDKEKEKEGILLSNYFTSIE